jgi:hypothetical protein
MLLSDTIPEILSKTPPVNRIRSASNYHTFAGGHCHWLATIMHLRGIVQIYRYQQANLPLHYVICVLCGCWVVAWVWYAAFVAVLLDFMV